MFETIFTENAVKTHRGLSVVASFMLQIGLLSVALLVPLVNPALLPRAAVAAVFLAAPALPPAPRPPAPPSEQPKWKVERQLLNPTRLVLPARIPAHAATIDDGDLRAASVDFGVVGSLDGFPRDSAVRGIGPGAQILDTPPPPPPVSETVVRKTTPRVRIGGQVQDASVMSRRMPVYPPLARQSRVEGKVIFAAVIGSDGLIHSLQLLSGHPLLVSAASEAVRQWRYRPTLLNGEPVEVLTTIEVNFTLQR